MRIEKKVAAPDSATLARRDSIYRADSLRRADSLSMLSKSSLEMPVFSTARDTMVEVFSDEIKPGAQLIVVGQGRLIDGSPLKITK